MATHKRHHNFRRRAACLAVASCFCSGIAQANPTNPSVVSGSATFSSSGNTLTVTNTPSAIINWQSFGISAGETVQFLQQSAASSVLNRVTGGNVSQILGTLQSNGKVFLINPAGVVFGQGATVDVGGLVASTLNITDADFLAGRMRFNADTAAPGGVSNAGQISTPSGGFVWLLAPDVANSGVIHTPSGEAVLAAGYSVELVDSVNPDQRVVVSAQSQDVNLSQLMTANDGNIFSVLNSGTASANTAVVGEEGRIYFKSAGNIQTTALSVVEAHGDHAADGGRIQAFANGDGLYAGLFDVSGRSGGFVETSGSYLDINSAQIRMQALDSAGTGGTWLLDPIDIFITSSQPPNCIPNTSCVNQPSYMYGSTISAALANGNVIIETGDGSITIDDSISTNSNTNNLTLVASNDIVATINAFVVLDGGTLKLEAGNNINLEGGLDANNVLIQAGQNFSSASASLAASNLITIDAANIDIHSGSDLAADYIGLNSNNFQTQTASFFNSGSTASITIDASTVIADVALSVLGANVSILADSDVTAVDMLHGIAKNILTVDNSTLGGANDTRLEVGNHLYIQNAAFVTASSTTTLYFDFPLIGANGWSVDGVLNAITGLSGSKIVVGNFPAVLGSGFIVTYNSPLIGSIVNQTFGQTSDAPYAPGGLPPTPPPDFFGADPGTGGGSLCTGTAAGDVTCATADAGSATAPDSGIGVGEGSRSAALVPDRQSDETLQNREPQECR